MTTSVSLEQVERMAEMLPLQDQLKLLTWVSQRLSTILPSMLEAPSMVQSLQQERLRLAEQLLEEVQAVDDDAEGTSDAAESIKQMRQERIGKLCRNDA